MLSFSNYFFNRENQAKIFDELDLKFLLINQHQPINVKVKHRVFKAIFGALYLLFDMGKAYELLKQIGILMKYEELSV